jgi:hypothetical protein
MYQLTLRKIQRLLNFSRVKILVTTRKMKRHYCWTTLLSSRNQDRSACVSVQRAGNFLCQGKDGTSTWVSLKDMQESYPIESAEYAVNNKIAGEPAFACLCQQSPTQVQQGYSESQEVCNVYNWGIRVTISSNNR